MRITVLTDNTPSREKPGLQSEHGLSLFIEHEGSRILCDTGLTGLFLENAATLGLDLKELDFAFISHGHNDHSGGLGALLAATDCNVFMHNDIACERYYSARRGSKRDISSDHTCIETHKERMTLLQGSRELAEGIYAINCTGGKHRKPLGNRYLTAERNGTEQPDNFAHELSLAFVTAGGLVIVSPCSHNGALNIIEESMRITGCSNVKAFVGGLHFVDDPACRDEAMEFAATAGSMFPQTKFHTGHCTCDKAKLLLAEGMTEISFFCTGSVIEF